jgi:hypothetical protein
MGKKKIIKVVVSLLLGSIILDFRDTINFITFFTIIDIEILYILNIHNIFLEISIIEPTLS